MHPIELLILDRVELGKQNNKGWHQVRCRVCNDHTRKGLRAGFKFEHDIIGYQCFNCRARFKYKKDQSTASKEFFNVLFHYGISEEDVNLALLDVAASLGLPALFDFRKTSESKTALNAITPQEPPEIKLPSHFYPFSDGTGVMVELAREYLKIVRKIDPDKYPFLLSDHRDWSGRLIIPVFKDSRLIYYTGRDMLDTRFNKYKNCTDSTENVMYGFDELFKDYDKPLYIYEGIFDAMTIPGIAVLTNQMTQGQIRWLRRCPRKKVIVPDRKGDGDRLAYQGLELGWHVSTPDIGSAKDINEAVDTLGKIFVMKSMRETIATGIEGKLQVGITCQK